MPKKQLSVLLTAHSAWYLLKHRHTHAHYKWVIHVSLSLFNGQTDTLIMADTPSDSINITPMGKVQEARVVFFFFCDHMRRQGTYKAHSTLCRRLRHMDRLRHGSLPPFNVLWDKDSMIVTQQLPTITVPGCVGRCSHPQTPRSHVHVYYNLGCASDVNAPAALAA